MAIIIAFVAYVGISAFLFYIVFIAKSGHRNRFYLSDIIPQKKDYYWYNGIHIISTFPQALIILLATTFFLFNNINQLPNPKPVDSPTSLPFEDGAGGGRPLFSDHRPPPFSKIMRPLVRYLTITWLAGLLVLIDDIKFTMKHSIYRVDRWRQNYSIPCLVVYILAFVGIGGAMLLLN